MTPSIISQQITPGDAMHDVAGLMSASTLGIFGLAVALLITLFIYQKRGESDLLQTLQRGAFVLLPIILVTVIAITTVLGTQALEIPLRQAILAGLIIIAGWLTTFVFQEERKLRDRRAQEMDILLALRSEIFTIVEKLDNFGIKKNAQAVQQKISQGGDAPEKAYFPFAASESPATVYDAMAEQMHIVNATTLEPVLRFYAAFSELGAIVQDTHKKAFRRLEASRRVLMHQGLTRQRRATLYWGLRALVAINVKVGVEDPENIPRSGKNEDISI